MGLLMRNGVAYAGSNSIELTQAEYNALVSAGAVQPDTFYCIVDADNVLPASDVEYSSGVSVADKLDTIPSFTPTEVSITKHNFSTNDTQVVRVGNLLICSIVVSNTSTYNSWTDFCSITGSFDSNITILASLSTWDKSRYAQAYMYNTNEIRIRIMGADANASYRGQMIIPVNEI